MNLLSKIKIECSKDRRPPLESQVSQTSELSREVKPVPHQAAARAVIQGPLIASERLPVGKKYI